MQMPASKALQTALRDWRQWPTRTLPTMVRQFTDGANHQAWLLESDEQQWALKIFEDSGRSAIEIQRWAADLQLAPEIVFAPADFSYALMSYLPDQAVPGDVGTVAVSLRDLHAQEAAPGIDSAKFELLDYCDCYLKKSGGKAHALHQLLLPILNRFVQDKTPPVFCHNDLVGANCLLDQGRSVFIDWEFARPNNPWFDLASIIVYQRLDPAQAREFLGSYDKAWAGLCGQPICVAAQCAVLWLDMLWYLQYCGTNYWNKLESKHTQLRKLAAQLNLYF